MIAKFILIIIFGLSGSFQKNISTEKIIIDADIQLIPVSDSVYVHVSWQNSSDFGRFPSNGLILIKKGKGLMIDTPMDNAKTRRLLTYFKDSMQVEVTRFIAGHYHDDCIGGLEYIQSKGIESIANILTIKKCKTLHLPAPAVSFSDSLLFDFNGEPVECRFFGAGHTYDNITIWFPNKRLLFGGCLVKSIGSSGLGYTADADINAWDTTVKKVLTQYKNVKTVIPGHGAFGGPELLTHTIELVEKAKKR